MSKAETNKPAGESKNEITSTILDIILEVYGYLTASIDFPSPELQRRFNQEVQNEKNKIEKHHKDAGFDKITSVTAMLFEILAIIQVDVDWRLNGVAEKTGRSVGELSKDFFCNVDKKRTDIYDQVSSKNKS